MPPVPFMPVPFMLAPSMLAALALATLPTQVWKVDASNSPGTDFVDLQLAVDTAQAGDVLIVETGSYDPFQVSGKGLSILAADGAQVVVDVSQAASFAPTRISFVPTGQQFLLRGVEFSGQSGLEVTDNLGAIALEGIRCSLRSSFDLFSPDKYCADEALRVRDSALVWMAQCSFEGAAQLVYDPYTYTPVTACSATTTGEVSHSTLVIHDSTFEGPFPGVDGLSATQSSVFATNSSFTGATGGSLFLGAGFVFGLDGAHGVELNDSVLWNYGSTFVPGAPGYYTYSTPLPSPGDPVHLSGGSTLHDDVASKTALEIPGVLTGGSTLTFQASVEETSALILVSSTTWGGVNASPLHGVVAVAGAPNLLPLGVVPGGSTGSFDFPIPSLPPGLAPIPVIAQLVTVDVTSFVQISAPTWSYLLP